MRKAQPFQMVWDIQDKATCKKRFLEAYQNMEQQYIDLKDETGTLPETESYNKVETL